MLYLNADNIYDVGINWPQLINVIRNSVVALADNDYAQPIKPYLRYGNPKNRIIAMPAFVGGEEPLAGIKWIASFPENIYKNKLRAHSVTILNESDTGVPICVINTPTISAIRTAAVSGLILEEYLKISHATKAFTVGITGFGPIGRMHLKLVQTLLGEKLQKVLLYDINPVDLTTVDDALKAKLVLANNWQEAYTPADIFITCTVSDAPYIDLPPKKGSLQLNVSLRDYKAEMRPFMDLILVDDWDEVCRQNTDIENMHNYAGLQKNETHTIVDVVCNGVFASLPPDAVIMFNPMGMAIFDIAVGGHYYREAIRKDIGIRMQ